MSSHDPKGSASRAAAGAVRIGNVLGAALTNRRVIDPIETRLIVWTGFGLLVVAVLFVAFPRVLAYPAGVILAWFAAALLYRREKRFGDQLRDVSTLKFASENRSSAERAAK